MMRDRNITIFYILDTAGHVKSPVMSSLNHAMEEALIALTRLLPSVNLSLAVLEYNSGANWILLPTLISNVEWNPIYSGGLCDLGEGINELERKLNNFLGEDENNTDQNYYPIFIFMLAGYPTDDYLKPLKSIQNNLWFKKGVKIAFAIGDDPDICALKNITGTSEAVITSTDLDEFKDLLCLVEINKNNMELHY